MHVEQFLHGYNNGHHLIAGSASLPLMDADRMSYLSDWSGYVNPFNKDTSYITAYPLAVSQCYVIAMSWYAEEMSRPGCVWTHSLVVKIDGLGQKVNFYDFLKLFRRPEKDGEDFMSYTKSIELEDENNRGSRGRLDGIDGTRFMYMTAMLLDRHKPAIYAVEKESEAYIELCMRLIQNMPYGILKELTICSGSAAARKFEKGFYNLQFVTGKGESLYEPYPDHASKPKADAGFQFWMDAVLNGRDDVAQMLHRFSEDIENESNHFLATLNLLRLLDVKMRDDGEEATVSDVVEYLVNGFPEKDSGAFIKRSFLSEQVIKYFGDEKDFILLLGTTQKWEAIDYKAIGFGKRVEIFRNGHPSEDYLSLLMSLSKAEYLNEEGKALLSNALEGLSNEEVEMLLSKDWALFKSIVTMNAHVLSGDFWIDLQSPQFISLFSIFQRNMPEGFEAWGKLYRKLLTIDTFVADNILLEIANNVSDYVTVALDEWNSNKKPPINKTILGQCMKQKSRVILWMGQRSAINDNLRTAIKRSIVPDETVVVSMGSNAWKAFVDSELAGQIDANELAYVYVLSFNWRDYVALGYLRRVLPYIYEALSLENLSYSAWKKIERFTGSVPFWRSWDNCRKVLIGVRDHCKTMNLQEVEIAKFTTNPKLNGELLELWRKG